MRLLPADDTTAGPAELRPRPVVCLGEGGHDETSRVSGRNGGPRGDARGIGTDTGRSGEARGRRGGGNYAAPPGGGPRRPPGPRPPRGGRPLRVARGAFRRAGGGPPPGTPATPHHDSLERLAKQFPDIEVRRGLRFVESSPKLATAGGLSSGIDLALRVVERYFGRPAAERTATYMEYQGRGWVV